MCQMRRGEYQKRFYGYVGHRIFFVGAFRRGNKPPVLPEEDKKL